MHIYICVYIYMYVCIEDRQARGDRALLSVQRPPKLGHHLHIRQSRVYTHISIYIYTSIFTYIHVYI